MAPYSKRVLFVCERNLAESAMAEVSLIFVVFVFVSLFVSLFVFAFVFERNLAESAMAEV